MLASNGAKSFATRLDPSNIIPDKDLVSEKAQAQWHKWSNRLLAEEPEDQPAQEEEEEDIHQDTVGALSYDHTHQKISSGVSR